MNEHNLSFYFFMTLPSFDFAQDKLTLSILRQAQDKQERELRKVIPIAIGIKLFPFVV